MIRKILITASFLAVTACNMNNSNSGFTPTPTAESAGITSVATPAPVGSPTPAASPTPVVSTPSKGTPSLAGALGINDSVDLRAYDGPIVSQFGGTCSTFGTAAAMDNKLHQKGINKLVSERDLWAKYGVYDMDAAIAAASSNYVTEEQYWPISNVSAPDTLYKTHESLKITQSIAHEYNMNAALQGLSQGHPLVMAIQVPNSLGNCDANIDPNSSAGRGQHVMEAVGYKLDDSISGGGYFILKNSWGTGCGDKGYHYFPFSLCSRSDLYCYFTEIVDVEDRS